MSTKKSEMVKMVLEGIASGRIFHKDNPYEIKDGVECGAVPFSALKIFDEGETKLSFGYVMIEGKAYFVNISLVEYDIPEDNSSEAGV
jgi:hypothetical protein